MNVAAFLQKPRRYVNGEIKPIFLTIFGKMDFIIENAELLACNIFTGMRGRPRKDFKFDPWEMVELNSPGTVEELREIYGRDIPFESFSEQLGKGKMPGSTYIRRIKWFKRVHIIFYEMQKAVSDFEKTLSLTVNLDDVYAFLRVLANACVKLNRRQIRTIIACGLVKSGFKITEAASKCGVKYETVKNWLKYFNVFLNKIRQFRHLDELPEWPGMRLVMRKGRVAIESSMIQHDGAPPWLKEQLKSFKKSFKKF